MNYLEEYQRNATDLTCLLQDGSPPSLGICLSCVYVIVVGTAASALPSWQGFYGRRAVSSSLHPNAAGFLFQLPFEKGNNT